MKSRPELTHDDCVKISAASLAEARKNNWNVAIAILDELDSGLDIDALRDCARRVEDLSNDPEHPLGVLAITHYSRLLTELRPDRVHILVKGRIVAEGGPELADRLEIEGYAAFAPVEDLVDERDAEHVVPADRPSSLDDLFALQETLKNQLVPVLGLFDLVHLSILHRRT